MDSFKASLVRQHDGVVSGGFIRMDRRALDVYISKLVFVEIGGG